MLGRSTWFSFCLSFSIAPDIPWFLMQDQPLPLAKIHFESRQLTSAHHKEPISQLDRWTNAEGIQKKLVPNRFPPRTLPCSLPFLWPCQPISFTTTSFDVLSNPVDSPKKFTGWQLPGKMNASEPHSYPIHCHKLVKPPMFRYQGHVPILGFHSNRPFTPSSLRLSFTVSKRFWWPTWSKGGGWLMFFLVGESSIDRSCP